MEQNIDGLTKTLVSAIATEEQRVGQRTDALRELCDQIACAAAEHNEGWLGEFLYQLDPDTYRPLSGLEILKCLQAVALTPSTDLCNPEEIPSYFEDNGITLH